MILKRKNLVENFGNWLQPTAFPVLKMKGVGGELTQLQEPNPCLTLLIFSGAL